MIGNIVGQIVISIIMLGPVAQIIVFKKQNKKHWWFGFIIIILIIIATFLNWFI